MLLLLIGNDNSSTRRRRRSQRYRNAGVVDGWVRYETGEL